MIWEAILTLPIENVLVLRPGAWILPPLKLLGIIRTKCGLHGRTVRDMTPSALLLSVLAGLARCLRLIPFQFSAFLMLLRAVVFRVLGEQRSLVANA